MQVGVCGRNLEVGHYFIRFPGSKTQLNAPLLKMVGGVAPEGQIRVLDLELGEHTTISTDEQVLIIHM